MREKFEALNKPRDPLVAVDGVSRQIDRDQDEGYFSAAQILPNAGDAALAALKDVHTWE